MGEHAAVYGHPALIAAIDRRTTATLEQRSPAGGRVTLELPRVGVAETVSWRDLHDYARARREHWQAFDRDPGPEGFARVRGDDPAHLVKVALGEAAAHTGQRAGGPDLHLRLDSTIPIGAGFGSSASVAAAVVFAYLLLRGGRPTASEIEPLVREVERRQHGRPSGVDGATVLRGGLVWAERDGDGRLVTMPIAGAGWLLGDLAVFNTGAPAVSTGAVVAAVRRRHDADPGRYGAVLTDMAEATRALRAALGAPAPARVIDAMRRFERGLEALGVVPEAVRETVREIESGGGAAKISGAGTIADVGGDVGDDVGGDGGDDGGVTEGAGAGAGSLLVYDPRGDRAVGRSRLERFDRLQMRLGAPGVRREAVA